MCRSVAIMPATPVHRSAGVRGVVPQKRAVKSGNGKRKIPRAVRRHARACDRCSTIHGPSCRHTTAGAPTCKQHSRGQCGENSQCHMVDGTGKSEGTRAGGYNNPAMGDGPVGRPRHRQASLRTSGLGLLLLLVAAALLSG
jgi:hypothetical protein